MLTRKNLPCAGELADFVPDMARYLAQHRIIYEQPAGFWRGADSGQWRHGRAGCRGAEQIPDHLREPPATCGEPCRTGAPWAASTAAGWICVSPLTLSERHMDNYSIVILFSSM